MEDTQILKLIVPAYMIPNKALVTRGKNAVAEYILTRGIRFFPVNKEVGEKETITAKDGCVFLVSGNGDVNVYPPHTELVWLVAADELHEYLAEKLDHSPHK